jgi:glutamate 5-kinase
MNINHAFAGHAFVEQALPAWKRAVLKVGSSLLAGNGGLSPRHAVHLAAFAHAAHAQGRELVIVSSGAVAAGRALLRATPQPGAAMAERQALAALGQAKLMAFWQGLFAQPVAQVLLTHDDVRNRRRYLNARATLRELLRCGALPVVNENDTVSVDELKLGDNDTLAAIVAGLIDADVLFIATDIDGLYDRDPRANPDAKPMPLIVDPGEDILAMAGGAGSNVGTGGMRTKILAAQRAGAAGIDTVLFNGTRAAVAQALGEDRLIGTRLVAGRSRIAARKHWLRHAPVEAGAAVLIDIGAATALTDKGASLLPIGVVGARGEFRRGDLVEIVLVHTHAMRTTVSNAATAGDVIEEVSAESSVVEPVVVDAATIVSEDFAKPIARGVSQYSAADIRRIARKRSHQIEAILGYNYGDSIVHRDDLSLYAALTQEPVDV